MTYWILSKLIGKHNFSGPTLDNTRAPDLLARPTGHTPLVPMCADLGVATTDLNQCQKVRI